MQPGIYNYIDITETGQLVQQDQRNQRKQLVQQDYKDQ
jgi:hypothetical protein